MKNQVVRKICVYIFLFYSYCSIVYAQNNGIINNWYFGDSAGISFSTGNPLSITGAINTSEGSAVCSDINGNLLFSTDGISVYNSNNIQMPNGFGLWGNESSTQSALIVPNPGNTNQYYIFTVGANAGYWGGYNGIAYSMVDMSLNSGLGDVINKNVLLINPAAEKLTAIKHCNGTDYWVICHEWNSDAFYTYQVTATGVSVPIISHVGSLYQTTNGDNSEAIGYLKASPNGKKLAAAISWVDNNDIELFDFNNGTGVISNPVYIPTHGGAYGLSFSPDNSKLYVGFFPLYVPTANIIQYHLNVSPITSFVVSSIPNFLFIEYGSLQLGPDGKIYVAVNGASALDVINYPNLAGAACSYTQTMVSLGSNISELGLPNFADNLVAPINSNFLDLGPDTSLCGNAIVIDAGTQWASYLWSTGDTSHAITVNQSGSYFVRVTTNCGDIFQDTINVTSLAPLLTIGNDTTLCNGASLNLDAGAGGIGYLWINGATTQTTIASSTGMYWVNKTYTCGIAKDTININVSPPIIVNLENYDNPCSGGFDTLVAIASGGTGALLYSLNGGTFQGSPVFLVTTGTYAITVKDIFGCSTLSDSIYIQTNDFFTLNTSVGIIACYGDTTNLVLNVVNGIAPFLYSFNGGTFQTSNTFVVGGGWYSVTLQDSNHCLYPNQFIINQPNPITAILSATQVSCDTSHLTVTASGGTGNFQYSLNGGVFQNSNIFSVLAGNYTVTVQDINGCQGVSNSIAINQPIPITATVSAGTILCNGGTTTLSINASGGTGTFQYSLNGINFQLGNTFVVGAGTYTVTVQDLNGCTFISNAIIITQPAFSINTNIGTIACNGGTTTLSITANGQTAPFQYSLNGGIYQTNNTFTIGAGIANISIQDSNLCIYPYQFLINEPPAINVSLQNMGTITCIGDTTTLLVNASGGTGILQYSLNGGVFQNTNSFIVNANAGNYIATVQDINGCINTSNSIILNNPTQMSATLNAGIIACHGGTTTLTVTANGGVGTFQYSLDGINFQLGNTFVVGAGTYTAIVKINDVCMVSSNTLILTEPNEISANITADAIACYGGNTNVSINANGGTSPFQYSLDGASFQNSNTFSLGSGIYTFTLKDAYNCLFTTNPYTLTAPNAITATLSSGNIPCAGANTTLQVSASGGIGNLQYSLNGTAFQTVNVFSNIVAGTYTVTVKDANDCVFITNPININEPSPIIVNANAAPIPCHDESTTLSINASGGTGAFQYSLNGSPYQNANSFVVNGGNYTIMVQDANGCITESNLISIVNPPLLSINASTSFLCHASTTTLHVTANGGTGIKEYSLNGGIYQSPNNFIVGEGTYNISVKDEHNCTANTAITLIASPKIYISSLQIDSAYCNGENGYAEVIALGGNGIFSYTWLTNPPQYSPILQNVASGTYTIYIKDKKGCGSDSTIAIPNIALPLASYISRPDISPFYENDEIQFFPTLSGVYSYSWDFGDGTFSTAENPIHVFSTYGDYNVTLTGFDKQKSCPTTYTLPYHIQSRCRDIFISNAFSPNEDGHNDTFYFVGEVKEFHATFFDRWGKIVKEFSSIKDIWNGQNCPEGVYTYVLKAICPDGSSLKRGGTITLTR